MPTPLRQLLIFQLNRRRAGPFKFNNGPLNIRRVTESGIRIHDHGNTHPRRQIRNLLHKFRQRKQPNIRQSHTPAENAAPDRYMAEKPISSIIRPMSAFAHPALNRAVGNSPRKSSPEVKFILPSYYHRKNGRNFHSMISAARNRRQVSVETIVCSRLQIRLGWPKCSSDDIQDRQWPSDETNQPTTPPVRQAPLRQLAEVLLIVLIFFIATGDPTPSVNETHYIARLKHFWNPEWCKGDLFLESTDTQVVFIWLFGWLTRWLSLSATTWVCRIVAWVFLAWSWQRLSWRLVPRPLAAALSAALFLALNNYGQMAGEWVVGGVEAKCFAYRFVLMALRDMIDRRWGMVCLLFGASIAFHPIVGGWSVAGLRNSLAHLWSIASNHCARCCPESSPAPFCQSSGSCLRFRSPGTNPPTSSPKPIASTSSSDCPTTSRFFPSRSMKSHRASFDMLPS